MSPKRVVFISSDGAVVQVIRGELSLQQLNLFSETYSAIYGQVAPLVVENPDVSIWIGGSYTDGEFAPPPSPEPLPEPLPEPQLEP